MRVRRSGSQFLNQYVRLLNCAGQWKVLIDVAGRYLARIDRIGNDLKAVFIRIHYFDALILNRRYSEADGISRQLLPIDDRLRDRGSRLYVLAYKLAVSDYISPMPHT